MVGVHSCPEVAYVGVLGSDSGGEKPPGSLLSNPALRGSPSYCSGIYPRTASPGLSRQAQVEQWEGAGVRGREFTTLQVEAEPGLAGFP